MQPYFNPTRKTTSKKMENNLQKNNEDDLNKNIKNEDDLIKQAQICAEGCKV